MSTTEPRIGDRLGRYRLVEVLGRGGMGTVYRGRDDELQRDVAVKVINPALAGDAEFRERFRREAVVLSQMDSAHVVSVYDHGEQGGAPYLVTQLVRGGDLLALIGRTGALQPGYAIDLAGQVLEGLADAHAAGVVHRDVKPSNVLLREDGAAAYLCDFGIATSPGRVLTQTGVLVGSTAYMAPERHSADTAADAGESADVYAAGCLLWTMLTGTQPYVGTDAEVAMGHLHGPLPQLPGRSPFLDEVNAVLRRALAKDPRNRYPSARSMRRDLEGLARLVPGALVLPDVTAIRQPVVAAAPRAPWRRVLVTAVVVALVAGGVYVGSLLGGVELAPSVLASDDTTTSSAPASPTSSPTSTPTGTASTTAAPRKKRPKAISPTTVFVVPEGVREAEAVAAPTRTASGTKRSGGTATKPRTTSTPKPSPTPTPTPQPKYRCWNGTEVMELSSCTVPTGWAGAKWVFPGAGAIGGCFQTTRNAPGFIEGYTCSRTTGDGTKKSVTFIRWASQSEAVTYYRGRYDKSRYNNVAEWSLNGVVAGRRMAGWTRNGFSHTARTYRRSGIHWAMAAQGKTVDKRSSMFNLVSFRMPADLKGVPIG